MLHVLREFVKAATSVAPPKGIAESLLGSRTCQSNARIEETGRATDHLGVEFLARLQKVLRVLLEFLRHVRMPIPG